MHITSTYVLVIRLVASVRRQYILCILLKHRLCYDTDACHLEYPVVAYRQIIYFIHLSISLAVIFVNSASYQFGEFK